MVKLFLLTKDLAQIANDKRRTKTNSFYSTTILMNKKISFLVTIGLCVFKLGHSQEQNLDSNLFSDTFQASVIGQLEKDKERTFLLLDSVKQVAGGSIVFTDEDVNIAQRIQRIQKTIPLEYNAKVKAYLDKYISKNYKPYMEKLLGLSQYYFPIYDQILGEQGLPEEVKFLSVVESSLNPHTVSTSGAVGPWQFMYGTAKGYDLVMDSNFDERKDIYSSTYAFTTYITEAYDEFNDWLLALASYNCGRGCVRRAIIRSGLKGPSYWELSPYLPKETQNYIPKFIAITYVLNHAELYGLNPQVNDLQTDHKVMMLDKSVNLEKIAAALSCSTDVLKQLNPAYKREVIVASSDKPRRLIIPYNESMNNDSLIYAALNNQQDLAVQQLIAAVEKKGDKVDEAFSKKVVAASKANNTSKAKNTSTYVSYVVRKGDTLSEIAQRYRGATVSKIKSDNNLKNSNLKIGQKLKIYKGKS